ncbi:hypothetical protein [Hydrogenophaga sp.]|uniref:hypothetical protein n=1 Tax=Hydrogenophaga sp. TaxID=1904254 RepID=UPI00271618DA|nr:hypothetical protein [Hydrogenophaga sp.]MDO9435720.1 hypothetical protein [Hydrogenophaga sp.]
MKTRNILRMDLYERLVTQRESLLQRADEIGRGLGIPAELKGLIGTSGASSAFPGSTREDVIDAMTKIAYSYVSLRALGDDVRRLVKSVYGDAYDAAVTNSCEAALGLVHDALLTPPMLGRGDPYRSRCIGLLERHAEHHLSYGRPFPPVHKEVFADRGSTAGEFGGAGRRALNTDVVMVPMAGARYEPHGSKMMPSPLLMETDAQKTLAAVARAADVHAADLCGFITLGYDTQGYGYGEVHANGAPAIQCGVGELAARHGVPYVVDNAWGVPFIGSDPRKINADVMLYSMDKVAGAPTSGLVIGKDTAMVNVRRALGTHSERFGTTSAHGKGAHAAADPGKLTLAAMVHVLRVLRDEPERVTRPIDVMHAVVLDEAERFREQLGPDLVISKSYNLGGIEINYERTWSGDRAGIPIYTNEDRIAGAHILGQIVSRMGVLLIQSEDGNILVTPGLGTSGRDGAIDETRMRLVMRAVFSGMALLREWVQQQDQLAAHSNH